jgi:hypothetical protein
MRRSKVPILLALVVLATVGCSDDYGGDGDREYDGDPVDEGLRSEEPPEPADLELSVEVTA